MSSQSRRTGALPWMLAMLCWLIPVGATANEDATAGLTAPYALQASQQALLDVLRQFASDHGLTLRTAGDRKGSWRTTQLDGWVRAPTGRAFLEQLAHAHHFSWFVADRTLYVGAAHDSAVERIGLNGTRADSARAALEAVGIFDPRFGWGELAGQDAILVGGPLAYRALVRRFLSVQPAGGETSPKPAPMIFPLRFAQAGDTASTTASAPSRLGVAALLRSLLVPEVQIARPVLSAPPQSDILPPLPGTTPTLAPWIGFAASSSIAARDAPGLSGGSASASSRAAPIGVVADEGTNTVIVWGDPNWRAHIQQLVEALDRPAPLVSMDVLVIESDLSTLTALRAAAESTDAAPAPASPAFGDRLAEAVADRRVRLLNRQTLVGRMNTHTTLGIGGEASRTGNAGQPTMDEPTNGRGGNGGDRLDLFARIVPSPKLGTTMIAVDVDLLMAQPTGLSEQAWASTSNIKLDTRVTLESGAAPKLIASYPVATARAEHRAIFISAKAL